MDRKYFIQNAFRAGILAFMTIGTVSLARRQKIAVNDPYEKYSLCKTCSFKVSCDQIMASKQSQNEKE